MFTELQMLPAVRVDCLNIDANAMGIQGKLQGTNDAKTASYHMAVYLPFCCHEV